MIYDAARVRRLYTKFQVNTSKNKNVHFGGHFFFFFWGGGRWGAGDWTAVNIDILTDPRNGLKNRCVHFGNDRSHRLGGV